jgi:TRAP-type C4-dicarboxylate transport system permease small subunit
MAEPLPPEQTPVEGACEFIDRSTPLDGAVRVVRNVILAIACVTLLLLMVLIAFDVIGRYVFNSPIPGGYELTEYLMAVVVPLSVAYCMEQKSHVGVDLVVERISAKARRRVEIVTLTITLVLMGFIAWQNWVRFIELVAKPEVSAVLRVPSYPFFLAIPVGFSAFVLFTLHQLLQTIAEVTRR